MQNCFADQDPDPELCFLPGPGPGKQNNFAGPLITRMVVVQIIVPGLNKLAPEKATCTSFNFHLLRNNCKLFGVDDFFSPSRLILSFSP